MNDQTPFQKCGRLLQYYIQKPIVELYACQHFVFNDKYYLKETNSKYYLKTKLRFIGLVHLGNGVLTLKKNQSDQKSSFQFYHTNNRIHSLKQVHVMHVA